MTRSGTTISRLTKAALYADVIRRIGPGNVAYVAWYRFSLKTGIRRRAFPRLGFEKEGDFFRPLPEPPDCPEEWKRALLADAAKIAGGHLRYYARHWHPVGDPPDWFLNPFNGVRHGGRKTHWTALKDFDPAAGDIKNVWEASRFEWVLVLARAHAVSGQDAYLRTLNRWLRDWAQKNPVNTGPNWKCGQEASIRVFNLLLAARILRQWRRPCPALAEFIFRHLERIHGNIRYAIAQDNNHGTSEAAALFVAGTWLSRVSGDGAVARKGAFYARRGRKWLENRVERLVEADGSFSQHSVTYHRVLLDTLIFVELWRRQLDAAAFSDVFYARAAAALDWMAAMTDPASGGAPNLGSNDGAMLLHMHGCDYRDFRPTLQAAGALLRGRKIFAAGPWDEPLFWLGIEAREAERPAPAKASRVFPGGYVVMAGRSSWALLRFPMYRFRPSHNDVLHFDLWHRGENVCRDGGTYSYNPDEEADGHYFKSVRAHNTVSFDGQDQMPRLGRFMLGRWMRADHVGRLKKAGNGWFCWSGACTDWRGNRHRRTVRWRGDEWVVADELAGPFHNAEVRFRLAAGEYRLEGNKLMAPWGIVEVSGADCHMYFEEGVESLYYWEKSPVEVLVVSVGGGPRKIETRFSLGFIGDQSEQ